MEGYKRYIIVGLVVTGAAAAAVFRSGRTGAEPQEYKPAGRGAVIRPDYRDCVIPPNIAPLNFEIKETGKRYFTVLSGQQGKKIKISSPKNSIRIPPRSWKELLKAVRTVRGGRWLNSNRGLLSFMRKEWNKVQKRSLLFLVSPRLAFNPPVKKETLQKGSGWLSKRFLSFDELFSAWSGGSH